MVIHYLKTSMELPFPQEKVFNFFSDAANLERITPRELGFKILTPLPILMKAGAIIDYKLNLFKIPFKWRTEISMWNPPNEFCDEQITGPYREWVHKHTFITTENGTLIQDQVRYQLPLWPFGDIAHPLIRLQLNRIFQFRQKSIRDLLADSINNSELSS